MDGKEVQLELPRDIGIHKSLVECFSSDPQSETVRGMCTLWFGCPSFVKELSGLGLGLGLIILIIVNGPGHGRCDYLKAISFSIWKLISFANTYSRMSQYAH